MCVVFVAFPVDTDPHHAPSKFAHYETPDYSNMTENETLALEHILPIDCKNIKGDLIVS